MVNQIKIWKSYPFLPTWSRKTQIEKHTIKKETQTLEHKTEIKDLLNYKKKKKKNYIKKN